MLGLVKAFLKAGVLTTEGVEEETITGTPQGGIPSPLLANIALTTLDDHFEDAWRAMGTASQRCRRCRNGLVTYRLVRYADAIVVMVSGCRADAEALAAEAAAVLGPIGLRLSAEKTRIAHIDEGFDFLGFRIQRQRTAPWPDPYSFVHPHHFEGELCRGSVASGIVLVRRRDDDYRHRRLFDQIVRNAAQDGADCVAPAA